jgi:mannose-6-phosphate isomerase-like protein (cupin superfamily)
VYRSNERDAGYSRGEYGPAYLARGPRIDIGVILLRPGDEYRNHYHQHSENSFVTIEGEAVLWSDGRERFVLRPGDLHRCDPGEMHYLVNEGTVAWRAVFVRSPYDPADTVDVAWRPGEPPPQGPLA